MTMQDPAAYITPNNTINSIIIHSSTKTFYSSLPFYLKLFYFLKHCNGIEMKMQLNFSRTIKSKLK